MDMKWTQTTNYEVLVPTCIYCIIHIQTYRYSTCVHGTDIDYFLSLIVSNPYIHRNRW